ncbi:DUF1800 domain-containing protein [Aureliella helgolandensis]|uniref:DUF1800 domain-containing protein n=1 Tax=Aureliella helgolandensis TaxID=2527968 RepID=A0A518G283_9BACT|nr:DUF1800 domain-containing protein [Aureliella helgolandensis]QDV22711.1 hypothetical protein Q31a_09970 [Aureliella helgolandensis]
MSESLSMQRIDPEWAWSPFEPSSKIPWDDARAAHLFRRAGLGADHNVLIDARQRPPVVIVQELLAQNTEESDFRATANLLAETVMAGGDPRQLSAAWVYRFLYTPNQLLEKMTLFWHGHFATSAEKVQNARMMWNQNQFLREHALGEFSELVQRISKDPAMLIYLDSAVNRKAHPNENFARELMELFCLGEGNYSESDIQELARCFTGWEVKNKRFRKNRYQQDSGTKSILGQSGAFDGEDGIEIVLEQPQLELFLVRKWYRFFISDEPAPADELLQPLANTFREQGLRIAPVLQQLLSSNLFFSQHAMGRKIRSPVELILGSLRCLSATTNTQTLASGLLELGQGLFYPPNVKGWDGGRTWINSSTLLGRANLISKVLADDSTRFAGMSFSDYLEARQIGTPRQTIEYLSRCLLAIPLSDATQHQLLQSYERSSGGKELKLRALLHAVTSLPECQLG